MLNQYNTRMLSEGNLIERKIKDKESKQQAKKDDGS
jgi:hypothetical protein